MPIVVLRAFRSHLTIGKRAVSIPLMYETRAQTIRRLIGQTFQELGSPSTDPPRETLLIRNGTYCGHLFRRDDLRAVWFIEENQLKFYGADGCLIRAVQPLIPQGQTHQKAA